MESLSAIVSIRRPPRGGRAAMTEAELLELIDQAEREEWTALDLSGLGLTELPEEIGRLLDAVEFFARKDDRDRKTIYNISGDYVSGDYYDLDKIEGQAVAVGRKGQAAVDSS